MLASVRSVAFMQKAFEYISIISIWNEMDTIWYSRLSFRQVCRQYVFHYVYTYKEEKENRNCIAVVVVFVAPYARITFASIICTSNSLGARYNIFRHWLQKNHIVVVMNCVVYTANSAQQICKYTQFGPCYICYVYKSVFIFHVSKRSMFSLSSSPRERMVSNSVCVKWGDLPQQWF